MKTKNTYKERVKQNLEENSMWYRFIVWLKKKKQKGGEKEHGHKRNGKSILR